MNGAASSGALCWDRLSAGRTTLTHGVSKASRGPRRRARRPSERTNPVQDINKKVNVLRVHARGARWRRRVRHPHSGRKNSCVCRIFPYLGPAEGVRYRKVLQGLLPTCGWSDGTGAAATECPSLWLIPLGLLMEGRMLHVVRQQS